MSAEGTVKTAQKHAQSFVAEIDPYELAVRLIERGCKIKRPLGLSGREAWAQFEASSASGQIPEYILRDFEAMAHIAIGYLGECVVSLQRTDQ